MPGKLSVGTHENRMEVYCPQGHWALSEDIWGHHDHGISRVEARAAVPHPTVHRTAPPPIENDPGPNQQC